MGSLPGLVGPGADGNLVGRGASYPGFESSSRPTLTFFVLDCISRTNTFTVFPFLMKTIFALPCRVLVFGALLVSAALAQNPAPKVTVPPLSPASTIKQRVGFTDIEIVYSRPSARGRTMIGQWEPYGEIWRTGANQATKITFSTAVTFSGKELPAGTYALFSIPHRTEWTLIFNKAAGEWGAYTYKAENDVLRVTVKPMPLSPAVETFSIDINDIKTESATLNLLWEKTRVAVPFEFDVKNNVVAQIDAALKSGETLPRPMYFQAAMFYLDNDLDLNRARVWVEAATKTEKPEFYMLFGKARILAKLGDKAGATAAAKQSIAAAEAQGGAVAAEYTRRNQELLATLK
jgi:hypothetical protein